MGGKLSASVGWWLIPGGLFEGLADQLADWQWILDFDGQKPVEPISFELGLPVPVAGQSADHPGANGRRCAFPE